MAADDDATLTIDTNEMTYIDKTGDSHVVNNAETIVFALSAGVYTVITDNGLVCADGYTFYIEKDPNLTKLLVPTDATASIRPTVGTITVVEDAVSGGDRVIWDVRSATINDVDEPTDLTELIMERRDDPQVTITLSSVTMAQ